MRRALSPLALVAAVGGVLITVFVATEATEHRGVPGLPDLPATNDVGFDGVDLAGRTPCLLGMRSGVLAPWLSDASSTQLGDGDVIECTGDKASVRITADSIKACVTNGSCEGTVGGRRFEAKVEGESCFTFHVDLRQR